MDGTVDCPIFEFSAKLCKELDVKKNCVFSPLVAAEITMSTNALRRNDHILSGDMIFKTEQIGKSTPSSNLLSLKLKSLKGVVLNRASKVYLNIWRYKADRMQKKKIRQIYNVKIKNIDFAKSVDAADLINTWMEEKTERKIKNIIKYSEFDVDTNTIFVSGLYFKGLWHMKFDPNNTEETIFYLNNNETVNIFLMNRMDKYKYKDSPDLDAQLLLLPFKGEEAHMLIVLPKRITGLNRVLQKLAEGYDLMAEVGQVSQKVEVDVKIPRFKFESEINIADVLRKLGITIIFDKAVQKVLIEVNEEGAEPKPEPLKGGSVIPRWKPRPIDFIADHPHLIVILCGNIPIVWVTFRGRFE